MRWLNLTLTIASKFGIHLGMALTDLQRLQNRCARVTMNCRKETGQSESAMRGLGWISLAERRAKNKAKVMCGILHGLTPARLSNIFTEAQAINSNDNLRNSTKRVALPLPKRDSY